MTLARIERGPTGSVLECPSCERVQKVLAEPTKSHIAGWLSGALRPPE